MCYTFNDNKTLRHPRETGAKECKGTKNPLHFQIRGEDFSPLLHKKRKVCKRSITKLPSKLPQSYQVKHHKNTKYMLIFITIIY